jgi:hypothetical protein
MTRIKRISSGRLRGAMCGLMLVSAVLLSSCGPGPLPLALLNYTEASVCNANGGNEPNAPDTLVILVFEITSISNTSSNAETFTFHPALLFIAGDNGDDHATPTPGASSGVSLNGAPFPLAQTLTVPAGSTKTVNAGVIVTDTVAAGTYDIVHSNLIDFHLSYSTPPGTEGVLPVKLNENVATYPTNRDWGCPHYL